MGVGKQPGMSEALGYELKKRSGWTARVPVPPRTLPAYDRFDHNVTHEVFRQENREYKKRINKQELAALRAITGNDRTEDSPSTGDWIIVVPLGTKRYARLGSVVVWAPADTLESRFDDSTAREGLVLFRLYVQRLLINLFSNYYDMGPETYLPSYQRSGVKAVTLLCAQIRGFDRLCQIIHQRGDFNAEEKSECLRLLVNSFTETTADIIENLGGRIDQLWGSGLVAVFGEYLHAPEIGPSPGCQDALEASAKIVSALDNQAETWLREHFRLTEFKRRHADHVNVQAVIAIDHGEVQFGYVGGARHRVFMAVGDRVSFVKQLSTAVEADDGPSILLSQPAHELARHVLKDRPNDQVGAVHRQTMIKLPAMPWPIPVFSVWPESVDRAFRASRP